MSNLHNINGITRLKKLGGPVQIFEISNISPVATATLAAKIAIFL